VAKERFTGKLNGAKLFEIRGGVNIQSGRVLGGSFEVKFVFEVDPVDFLEFGSNG
jgi:hypothetical protein